MFTPETLNSWNNGSYTRASLSEPATASYWCFLQCYGGPLCPTRSLFLYCPDREDLDTTRAGLWLSLLTFTDIHDQISFWRIYGWVHKYFFLHRDGGQPLKLMFFLQLRILLNANVSPNLWYPNYCDVVFAMHTGTQKILKKLEFMHALSFL